MSSESEVTEFEQERIQHPTGHCEDCGCPLEICCKPKKPVVSVEELEKEVKRLEDLLHITEFDFSDMNATCVITLKDFNKWKDDLFFIVHKQLDLKEPVNQMAKK